MDAKTVTVSPNGQLVIPKEFRDALKMKGRARFLAVRERDQIILKPLDRLKALEVFHPLATKVRKRIMDGEITEADIFDEEEADRLGLA